MFEGMDSSYLFAYENQLYMIHNDGSVIEIDDCVGLVLVKTKQSAVFYPQKTRNLEHELFEQ